MLRAWMALALFASAGCQDAAKADPCRAHSVCMAGGQCTLKPGEKEASPSTCVATSIADCQKSVACRAQGLCKLEQDRCVATRGGCDSKEGCRRFGACSFVDGKCKAASDDDCAQSDACKSAGACSFVEGRCKTGKDNDCAQSRACKLYGQCTLVEGRCAPTINKHCRESEVCKGRAKACFLVNGDCMPDPQKTATSATPAVKPPGPEKPAAK